VVRLVAAVLILAAALVAPGRTRRLMRPARDVVGIVLALAAAGAVTYALASVLPTAVAVTIPAEASGRPAFEGHPVVLVAQVVNLGCYAVAAVIFTRRAARDDDELLGWVGAAAAVGVWARVLYLMFPSLYTEWLYAGDVLRLATYVLLLVGAVREIRAYWEAQVFVAADTERRRVARDLHDGVVQELGFILTEARRTTGAASIDAIGAAAVRAMDEAREAVTALAAAPDETLAVALHRAASEVGDRYDVPVRSSLDESVQVAPDARVQLVRIAREAVSNAARHAATAAITVTLSPGLLEVQDAGRGFDVRRSNGGFGLTSMRERAEAIGATVAVDSMPGSGTRVRVRW
jgi:signal transduction histidine kinase